MLPSPGLLNLTIARESWAAAMDEINGKTNANPAIRLRKQKIFDDIAQPSPSIPVSCANKLMAAVELVDEPGFFKFVHKAQVYKILHLRLSRPRI